MPTEYQKQLQEKRAVFYQLLEGIEMTEGMPIEYYTGGWNEEQLKVELVNMFSLYKAINKEEAKKIIAMKELTLKHLQQEINELNIKINRIRNSFMIIFFTPNILKKKKRYFSNTAFKNN